MRRSKLFVALTAVALLLGTLLGWGSVRASSGADLSNAADLARAHVRAEKEAWGLSDSDIAELVVIDQYTSEHTGVTHVYLQQQLRGIPVFNAIINVNLTREGEVLLAGNRAVANLVATASPAVPAIEPATAVRRAASALGLTLTEALRPLPAAEGGANATLLSDGGISLDPIPVSLVYQPVDGGVRLAWDVTIYELDGAHWWSVRVDAATGEMLSQVDWVVSESAEALGLSGGGAAHSHGPEGDTSGALQPSPLAPDAYRVFALPKESPYDGERTLETDPADALASPYGWHDINGLDGAEFITTQGNNAWAYKDGDADNVPDPGSIPNGGLSLTFDFPLDLDADPAAQVPAIVTNLFYWNNIMHDVAFRYGFNEAAGNFQTTNYTLAGIGLDHVFAEAQDGSGTNNANFATPRDGLSPRMQMYIWEPSLSVRVVIDAPAAIAGTYEASGATWGPPLDTTGLTADIVLGADGQGVDPNDGCEAITSDVAGKIAIVNRGNCNFTAKAVTAQNAGAIAVIVVNNNPNKPTTMGGEPTEPITIPGVMVWKVDGDAILANQPAHGTVKDAGVAQINRDSDLDNGVIAHEYGHGISNRLTGGPASTSCLSNEEQMGEGWSDWQALFMTSSVTDTATTRRGVGAYVNFDPLDGAGIRPRPYTRDMAVNEYTYANRGDANITVPHGLGFIWNTMLWDMYWNLVDAHGYNPDLYASWETGGNNLAHQLVMDGMKIQPCSPGFVDGRNAILAADVALTGGANQCHIWRAFARRGLGFSADQGSSASRTDGAEAFDLPAECGSPTAVALSGMGAMSPAPALPVEGLALGLLALSAGALVVLRRRRQA